MYHIFFVHSSADGHLASNFTPGSLCNQTSERCLHFCVDCGNHSNTQDGIFCFKTQPAELLEGLRVNINEGEREELGVSWEPGNPRLLAWGQRSGGLLGVLGLSSLSRNYWELRHSLWTLTENLGCLPYDSVCAHVHVSLRTRNDGVTLGASRLPPHAAGTISCLPPKSWGPSGAVHKPLYLCNSFLTYQRSSYGAMYG